VIALRSQAPILSKSARPERPQLELSGPLLEAALTGLIAACEPAGGIERYVDAVKAKSLIFKNAFSDRAETLSAEKFIRLCALMPTVRRRIDAFCDDQAFEALRQPLAGLFTEGEADIRIARFVACFPDDKKHRWVRDLAAEVLHYTDPERHPLMCRWIWDRQANSGVVREIWHGNVDHMTIETPDGYETFLVLREELSQYLSTNGVFRDTIWYVDLICAQVYAQYLSSQGGSYLRADFSSADDPAVHVRRMLGLDGIRAKCAGTSAPDESDQPLLLLTGERN